MKIDFSNKRIELLRPFTSDIKISSPFGKRKINGVDEFHYGYDFKTPPGTPVMACHNGAVFRAGWQDETNHGAGFGLRVWQEIEAEDHRFYIFYAHLSKIIVKEGDHIKRGQEIGFTGNTGRSTGPHCHVECRKKDSSDRYQIDWLEI